MNGNKPIRRFKAGAINASVFENILPPKRSRQIEEGEIFESGGYEA